MFKDLHSQVLNVVLSASGLPAFLNKFYLWFYGSFKNFIPYHDFLQKFMQFLRCCGRVAVMQSRAVGLSGTKSLPEDPRQSSSGGPGCEDLAIKKEL